MSLKKRSIHAGSPQTVVNEDGSMVRFGKIEQMDRVFDLRFWQSRTSEERIAAAWELVVDSQLRKGGTEDELRLQRAVGGLQRLPS